MADTRDPQSVTLHFKNRSVSTPECGVLGTSETRFPKKHVVGTNCLIRASVTLLFRRTGNALHSVRIQRGAAIQFKSQYRSSTRMKQ